MLPLQHIDDCTAEEDRLGKLCPTLYDFYETEGKGRLLELLKEHGCTNSTATGVEQNRSCSPSVMRESMNYSIVNKKRMIEI